MNEQEILDFLSHAETGALTDAMNLLHLDGWMEGIYPLPPDIRICGKAFTVQYERNPGPDSTVLNVFEIMELAEKGSVMVCSVPSKDAIVGENIMHATQACSLAGMVLDGVARDSGVIRRDQLPLFCRGFGIRLETACKITAVQQPVCCGGVRVRPGDYIVGDCDGVIAIRPEDAEAIIYQARRVSEVEAELERTIQSGQGMKAVSAVSAKKKKPFA